LKSQPSGAEIDATAPDLTTGNTYDALRTEAQCKGLTLLRRRSGGVDAQYLLRTGACGADGKPVEFIDPDLDAIADRINAADAVDLTADQARELTDQIKADVSAVRNLVIEAFTRRVWVALGYDSWDAYCDGELGTARLRLPRHERPEMVAWLRTAGMSRRAIAPALGVSEGTVRNDLNAGAQNYAPGGEIGETLDAEIVDTAEPEKITGRDGKSYPASKPAHEPITEPTPVSEPITELDEDEDEDEDEPNIELDEDELIDEPQSADDEPLSESLLYTWQFTAGPADILDGFVSVKFEGEPDCVIALKAKRLDKRITPPLAADLAYNVKAALPVLENLLGRLDRRAAQNGDPR
jgi:hypothetical protein